MAVLGSSQCAVLSGPENVAVTWPAISVPVLLKLSGHVNIKYVIKNNLFIGQKYLTLS